MSTIPSRERTISDSPSRRILARTLHRKQIATGYGQWIYFTKKRSDEFELWKMRKDGGGAVLVTRQGG